MFFAAHAEGLLPSEAEKRLEKFLESNPELVIDHDSYKVCFLGSEPVLYESKQELKKNPINEENRDEYFIRSIEKELTTEEQKWLDQFLSDNLHHTPDYDLFQKIVLPQEYIPFEHKEQLKKKIRKPVLISLYTKRTIYYAAAALALILAGLFFLFRNDSPNQEYMATNPGPAVDMISTKPDSTAEANQSTGAFNETNEIKNEISNKEKEGRPLPEKRFRKSKPGIMPVLEVAPLLNETKAFAENVMEEPAHDSSTVQEHDLVAGIEEKKDNTPVAENVSFANNSTALTESEYMTFGTIARKQLRKLLGIKQSNPCETEDRISVWDVSMAAKNGIQNLVGSKSIDLNRRCNGDDKKMEYVFAAGNFQVSKNITK